MERGGRGLGSVLDDTRGVSPLVGLVVLVGIVFVGATVSAIAGWHLIDSLEDENEVEITYKGVEATDQRITTAARTGQTQSTSLEGGTIQETGNVSIGWYDETGGVYDETRVQNERFGAIQYEAGDRTIVYQGGGIWEHRDGTYRAYSDPPIRDDGDDLEIRLVTLNGSDSGSGDRTIRPAGNDDAHQRLTDRPEDYDNLSVVIESEHRDGWEQYLEAEFAHDDDLSVTQTDSPRVGNGGDNTLEITVENVSETRPDARVVIDGVTLEE